MNDDAENIDELLGHLEAEDNGQYVYRGQPRDYGLESRRTGR